MRRLDQWITYWDNVRNVTLKFLDVYPPERLDFRPSDSVFTARQQFQHLIASETMWVLGWTEGRWLYPWQDGEWRLSELIDESFDTLPGLVGFYQTIHDRATRYLRSLPAAGGGRVFETHVGRLSVEAMVLYAVDEEIHHRAQLAVYLRLLGVEPPVFAQRYEDLVLD